MNEIIKNLEDEELLFIICVNSEARLNIHKYKFLNFRNIPSTSIRSNKIKNEL